MPTAAEAEAYLARVVDLARARDFTGLCALGGGNCETILDEAGRDAVPALPPTLLGHFEQPSAQRADGSTSVGGRVLVVCGIDGRGRAYRTEMLAFFEGSNLIAIEPIYWSGMGVATSPIAAPDPDPLPGPCVPPSPSPS